MLGLTTLDPLYKLCVSNIGVCKAQHNLKENVKASKRTFYKKFSHYF